MTIPPRLMNLARMGASACDPSKRWHKRHWIALGIGIIALIACISLLPLRQWLDVALEWVESWEPWSLVVFVGLYTVLATLAFPVTPLNIAAGVLFGVWWGFAGAMVGGLSAAMISFIIARHAVRDWVQSKLACNPKAQTLIDGIEEEPWKITLLTRLNPVVPASLKNYCLGVTGIRWPIYLTATAVAYAPLVFLYSYLGSAGHASFNAEHRWSAVNITLYIVGAVSTILLTGVLAWLGNRKLKELEDRRKRRASAPQTESNPPRPLLRSV